MEEIQTFWNRVARDWDSHIGEDGDSHRILNSDPALWDFAGDVAGLRVLDAGCGAGYLTRQLHARGATVIGVDFYVRMIEIAPLLIGLSAQSQPQRAGTTTDASRKMAVCVSEFAIVICCRRLLATVHAAIISSVEPAPRR